jgi:hypothetical protein
MRPVLILCLLFCFMAGTIQAAPVDTRPLTLGYEIYAGGIHALSTTLHIERQPDNYTVSLNTQPYGVIGNLLPWAGTYETKGQIKDGTFTPITFDKTSKWRDDNTTDHFVYKDGALVSQNETDETKQPPTPQNMPVDPTLAASAVDILTGTAQMLQQLDAGKPCDFSTIIYDGKRRYTLKFTDKGSETMVASDYNSFNGPAKICEIEMIPIAGFPKKPKGYYKIQEDARAKGQLPRVWVGRSYGYAGQDGPYVPVKMMVKSEFGAVLIHLQKVAR